MPDLIWFRAPADDDPGTLNACYHALDIHVIRGRADEVALAIDGTERTFAWLLTEVAACAGVLQAFGVGLGDRVVLGSVPPQTAIVVTLAVARVGGVVIHDSSTESSTGSAAGGDANLRVGVVDGEVGFGVESEQVPWDVAMRAGRTDPAGIADVPGDAILARHGDDALYVLEALGATTGPTPTTPGAHLVEVGGVRLWSFLTD
jgi:hypothetical protein